MCRIKRRWIIKKWLVHYQNSLSIASFFWVEKRIFASIFRILRRNLALKKFRKNRRKSLWRKDCVENSTQNIYCLVYFRRNKKKIDFIENHIIASKIRRKIKFASKNRREVLRRGIKRRKKYASNFRRKYKRRKLIASINRRNMAKH